MKNHILVFTLSILFPLAARAQLKFEQTQVELHPGIADKETVGHFKYQNTGDKPIHFRSVHASCGCTTAQTQKDVVQPGDKGEITATFKIGERTGTQIKTVTVETDDPANATTVLTLKAVLPEMLQIQPALITWNIGETAAPKTITVKPSKDFPVKQLNVTSPNPEFATKVERDSGSGEFKVAVTPKETTHPAATALTIQPEGTQKIFYATVRVMPAPPSPAAKSPATN
jgi:hypothetical protein